MITHKSFCEQIYEKPVDYERLEFLGDSILKMVTTLHQFKKFPKADENYLT